MNYGSPYQLPPRLPIWQWVEKYIEISARQPGRYHGRYSTALTPYMRGIFDAIGDPGINTISVMKGAQTGLTIAAYATICYWICEDGDPIMLVMPSEKLGKYASETRLQPMIQDSPRVAKELTGNPDDFKKLHYQTRSAVIDIVGANSPANLGSRPVRFLINDEVDKFPEQTLREARAVVLAIERTKTYEELRKVINISTPTNERGFIYQDYMQGDQRRFFGRCPECDAFQILEWGSVEYDHKAEPAKAAAKARYRCRRCKAKWDQAEFFQAVTDGKWKPTAKPVDPTHASFMLPAFLSRWVTMRKAVAECIETKQTPSEFQNFINSTLAEPWRPPPKKSIAQGKIREIQKRLVYPRGTIPTGQPCVVVMVTDVQVAHLVFSIWGMQLKRHFLIDHGYIPVIQSIDEIFARVYRNADGAEVKARHCMLDTGYDTMKAYEFAIARQWVIPIRGEQGRKTQLTRPVYPTNIDSFPGGRLFGGNRSFTLYHVHPRYFKDQLSAAIDGTSDVEIYFHEEIDDDFIRQMTAEVLREGKPDRYGQVETYWDKIRTNDFFDTAQYSFAARHLASNLLMTLDRRTKKGGDSKTAKKHATRSIREDAQTKATASGRRETVEPGAGAEIVIDPSSVEL